MEYATPTEATVINTVGTILLTAYLVVGWLTCRKWPRDERISRERLQYLKQREGRRD